MRFNYLILFILILSSCSTDYKKDQPKETNDKIIDICKIKYAKGFTINYYDNYKVLEIINPWQGALNVKLKYLLYPDSQPDNNIFPDAIRIKTPIEKIVCMSTTHIGFLDKLNEINSIIGITNKNLVYNDKVKSRIKSGEIIDIGFDKNLNYEVLISINPDLIMSYNVSSELSGIRSKLEELDIKMVLNAEYLESHPLGKAEWIKFIAAFYNKEEFATQIFNNIEKEYLELANKASEITNKPTVLTGLPWKGTWYISGGKSYPAKLISDAGGKFIWSENTSHEALALSIESVYEKAGDADIWINSGYSNSLNELLDTDERIGIFKAYNTGYVFNNNKRINKFDGNDYWESGIMNPQIILRDLIEIIHPEVLVDSTLYYYKRLN